ncbi:putative WRKY transcription factor 35 [Hordeum vulgare]|nr:putative WRKY transcription factor 35 [Hordeum vulgare]
MLRAVLMHLEGDNEPPLEYPSPSSSRRSGSSWLPRRMAATLSLSPDSRSFGEATPPVAVKPKDTPLDRRSRRGNLVINKGHHPSLPRDHLPLVKPKKEPASIVVVKKEHGAMAADVDAGLKWSHDDYSRVEMEHERHALEEIDVRCHDREEGDVIVLYDRKDDATGPTPPVRNGDPWQGAIKYT